MQRGSGLWAEQETPPARGLSSVPGGPASGVSRLGQREAAQHLN